MGSRRTGRMGTRMGSKKVGLVVIIPVNILGVINTLITAGYNSIRNYMRK